MALIQSTAIPSAASSYEIENSVRLELTDNQWMYRSSPTAGDKKTFTFSFWIKRLTKQGAGDPYLMSQGSDARFHFAGDTIRFMFDGSSTELESSHKLRDCSAWYHIVLAVDTTQGTDTNRVKLYLNGTQIDWNNSDWPGQNDESTWMSTTNMYIGTRDGDGDYDMSGYFADFVVIDGSQLTPASFGENDATSGIWKPKNVSGLTFGDEGYWLKFDSSGSMGADSSGNSNNMTLSNIAATNQTTDTPTNNFCVVNSVANNNYDSPSGTLEMGGNRIQTPASGWTTWLCTMPFSAGKWYIEMEDVGTYAAFGIMNVDKTHLLYEGSGAEGVAYRTWNGGALARDGNDQVSAGLGAPDSNNWVWGFWIDMDNGKFSVANRDGATGLVLDEVDIGNCFDNGRMVIPFVRHHLNTDTNINFGNGRWRSDNMMGWYASFSHNGYQDDNGYGNFEYSPNANSKSYYALCTKNLAEFGQ